MNDDEYPHFKDKCFGFDYHIFLMTLSLYFSLDLNAGKLLKERND